MRSICFYFQVHQPMRLRSYRFFDIGEYHNYYDDYQNRFILRRVADKCYLPMNNVLLDLIKEYGSAFKVSFSISGVILDQFRMYAPDVMESFRKLAATGSVEFLAETYSHSLSALKSKEEFFRQVNIQRQMIRDYFNQDPVTFRNTELIYSDAIGEMVAEMGFKTILTEGAKHILGWKSPNYLYCNAINPKLKVLLKNFQLSDDIAFRFSERSWAEWPLTTEKFVDWINNIDQKQEVLNLFMDYETFGEHQWPETGIFDFMKALPGRVFSHSNFTFNTPSEVSEKLQPVAAIHVQYPISWADEERDLTAWLGNDLQDDAFENLYGLEELVKTSHDLELEKDWLFLQTSDHFYYMCTKWFSDGDVHKYFNPYGSPYDAYINYMNVLSDFRLRLEGIIPGSGTKSIREIGKDLKDALIVKEKEITAKVRKAGTKARKTIESANLKTMTLEDLSRLSNAKIKAFLSTIDPDDIAIAMKDVSDEVTEKIIPNLSKEAKKRWKSIEHDLKKFRKTEIRKYRKKIESELRKFGF